MKKPYINELQSIHSGVLTDSWENFAADVEANKKYLLNFQPGPSFYWILNVKETCFEMISPEVYNVLGYVAEDFDFQLMFDLVHEEDKAHILNFEVAIANFFSKMNYRERFNYKLQYDYRLLHADGHYVRILNQMIIAEYNKETETILTFGVNADISHLKKDSKPVLSFIALHNDLASYLDVDVKDVYKSSKNQLTKREKQVLNLVLDGMMSKEICDVLGISKHTVDTHRKHLLEKTQSKTIPEMIKKAIVNGWI